MRNNPRFVLCIGAIGEKFPDIPEIYRGMPVFFDRQEKRVLVTIQPDYSNLICLEHRDFGTPFSDLERWLNSLDSVSLNSEGIAPSNDDYGPYENNEVVVEVRGGVAEVTSHPPGINVTIIDHDNH